MEFKIGETFGIRASVDEDNNCYESGNAFIKVHNLDATLVGRSHIDVMVTIPTSSNLVDNMSPNPLNAFHALSSCSPPSPFPECRNMPLINYHDVLKGNVVGYVDP